MDEFVEGFMSDDPEGLTPIDIVCDVTGLTLSEVRSSCKIVKIGIPEPPDYTDLDFI